MSDRNLVFCIASLRSKGHRNGGARRAVIELLGRQHCCLTAQEIFDQLRAEGRRVGTASVYRALEQLTKDGSPEGLMRAVNFFNAQKDRIDAGIATVTDLARYDGAVPELSARTVASLSAQARLQLTPRIGRCMRY